MSGYCNIFNTTAQTYQIGTMRYTIDAVFDTDSLLMVQGTMQFFTPSPHVVVSAVSIFTSPQRGDGVFAATIANPATFGVTKVFVDQGFEVQKVSDCSLSKYSKFVISGSVDGYIRNITFFE